MGYRFSQGFNFAPLRGFNKFLVYFSGGLFLLGLLARLVHVNFDVLLGISLNSLKQGYLFELVTYPFIFQNLFDFIFSLLILWSMGGELQGVLGEKRYRNFWLSLWLFQLFIFFVYSLVVPGGSYASLTGIHGFLSALLLMYGLFYPKREILVMMIFPVQCLYLCLGLVVIGLYSVVMGGGVTAIVGVSSLLFSYLYVKFVLFSKKKLLPSFVEEIIWRVSNFFKAKRMNNKSASSLKKGHLTLLKGNKEKEEEDEKSGGPKYWQ